MTSEEVLEVSPVLDGPEVPDGPGALLQLIRSGDAVTRAALTARTGRARSTVAQRVDALLASGFVYEAGDSASTGGRRPMRLAFAERCGVVLAADLGATHSRLAVSDLAGTPLAELALDMDIGDGPERVLDRVADHFDALLDESGHGRGDVLGVGVGIPGPVAHATGRPIRPPIMPGWDEFPVPDRLTGHFDVPVLVDNDVNLMALGERWVGRRDAGDLLYVKVGTGIGCGIIAGGAVHRGADGAAGDIGHVAVPGNEDVRCHCGNVGCLEAVAGGRALALRLAAAGLDASSSRDVVRLVRDGNPEALRQIRVAGRTIGEALASCVNFFNPRTIVVGGDIGEVHEHLLAGLRETLFKRSLPLATRYLRVVQSELGDRAGVIGGSVMAIEHVLAPQAVDRIVRERGARAAI